MTNYKNSKITNKVTLVERITSDPINQAFVVLEGSKSSLETAHKWAEGWNDLKYIDHTYINGNFKLEIRSAAENSYQSGKLSFWNCVITAPDDKQFLIGINSEALCQLILSSTFVNGKCTDEHLYLGKIANQTAAISKTSELYKQAMEDEALRKNNKTSNNKYEVGDLVGNLREEKVYGGEFYRLFSIVEDRYDDFTIYVEKEPEKVYCYYYVDPSANKIRDWIGDNSFLKTKPARMIKCKKHTDIPDPEALKNKLFDTEISCNRETWWKLRYRIKKLQYSQNKILDLAELAEIVREASKLGYNIKVK